MKVSIGKADVETKWTNSQNVRLGLGTCLGVVSAAYASVINLWVNTSASGGRESEALALEYQQWPLFRTIMEKWRKVVTKNYEINVRNIYALTKLQVD